jgi:hypothetical protein
MDLVLFEKPPERRSSRHNIRSDFALFSNRTMKKNYKNDLKFPKAAALGWYRCCGNEKSHCRAVAF